MATPLLTHFFRVCPLILGCILSFSGFSQNYIDLLRVDYSYSGNNQFDTSANNSDVKEWVVDATVPVVLREKTTLLTGFLYENVKVTPYDGGEELDFYTVNLKVGMNQTYSERWSATYMLLPKLSSDLARVGGNDFQLGGVSLVKYTKSPALNYRFGLYANSELFGPFLVPLFGLYRKGERTELNFLLPMAADFNYTLIGTLRAGFRFSGFKKSFHLNEPGMTGRSEYVSKANNEVLGYLAIAKGSINLIGFVGHSIGRSYRTYNVGDQVGLGLSAIDFDDQRTQLNTDFKDGLVFKVSVIYRYGLD